MRSVWKTHPRILDIHIGWLDNRKRTPDCWFFYVGGWRKSLPARVCVRIFAREKIFAHAYLSQILQIHRGVRILSAYTAYIIRTLKHTHTHIVCVSWHTSVMYMLLGVHVLSIYSMYVVHMRPGVFFAFSVVIVADVFLCTWLRFRGNERAEAATAEATNGTGPNDTQTCRVMARKRNVLGCRVVQIKCDTYTGTIFTCKLYSTINYANYI